MSVLSEESWREVLAREGDWRRLNSSPSSPSSPSPSSALLLPCLRLSFGKRAYGGNRGQVIGGGESPYSKVILEVLRLSSKCLGHPRSGELALECI